jgi:hypothetical protein
VNICSVVLCSIVSTLLTNSIAFQGFLQAREQKHHRQPYGYNSEAVSTCVLLKTVAQTELSGQVHCSTVVNLLLAGLALLRLFITYCIRETPQHVG